MLWIIFQNAVLWFEKSLTVQRQQYETSFMCHKAVNGLPTYNDLSDRQSFIQKQLILIGI